MYLSAEQIQYLDAAARGEVEVVRRLLASGMNPDTLDPRRLPRDRTALMHAAANGNLDVVELLLTAGAKVDAKDKGLGVALPGGNTALLLALKSKQVRVAQRLLDAGADPAVKCGGISAFGLAASLGDVSLLRKMLKKELSPDLTAGRTVDTPLVSALFARRTGVVAACCSRPEPTPAWIPRPHFAPRTGHPGRPGRSGPTAAPPRRRPQRRVRGRRDPADERRAMRPEAGGEDPATRGAAVNARSESGKTALDIAQDQLKRKPAAASSPETARQAADPVISAETGPESSGSFSMPEPEPATSCPPIRPFDPKSARRSPNALTQRPPTRAPRSRG